MMIFRIIFYFSLAACFLSIALSIVFFFTQDIRGAIRHFIRLKSRKPLPEAKAQKNPREAPQKVQTNVNYGQVKRLPPGKSENGIEKQTRRPSPKEEEYVDNLVAQKFEKISSEEKKQLKNAMKFATALLDADYTQALPDIKTDIPDNKQGEH